MPALWTGPDPLNLGGNGSNAPSGNAWINDAYLPGHDYPNQTDPNATDDSDANDNAANGDGTGWFPQTGPILPQGNWIPDTGSVLPQQDGPWFPGLDNAVGGVADQAEGALGWTLGGTGDFLGNVGNDLGQGVEGAAGYFGGTVGNLFGQLGNESGVGDAAGGFASFMTNMSLIMVVAFAALAALVVFV